MLSFLIKFKINIISVILIITGIALFAFSLPLHPYTDENAFRAKYNELSTGQSNEYYKLHDDFLTHKYLLQDIGITLISIPSLFLLFYKLGRGRLNSPKSKLLLILLAILLSILSVIGYVFDLFQGMDREEFPHWADSLGIPLMGVPVQFIFLLAISLLHLLIIKRSAHYSIPLSMAFSLKSNLWLLVLPVISFLASILVISNGQYWYAIPGLFWTYFFVSICAIDRINRESKINRNTTLNS